MIESAQSKPLNGDKFQTGMRLWLAQNWLILSLLVGGAGWGATMQATKVSNHEMQDHRQAVEMKLDNIAEELAYIKGMLDAQNKARGEAPRPVPADPASD